LKKAREGKEKKKKRQREAEESFCSHMNHRSTSYA